jgi:prepilin-type processing-associated H-X9-DG protein/prepilin-type N-terminal cleavage/methylation domain-containing protein
MKRWRACCLFRSVRSPGRRTAFTLLEILVVIGIIGVLLGLGSAAVQRARTTAAAVRCQNNLRQLAMSIQSVHVSTGALPPGLMVENGGAAQPFMNWHTRLLPYIEQTAQWHEAIEAFRLERDFRVNPPHALLGRVISLFHCPLDARAFEAHTLGGGVTVALTSYLGVEGTRVFFRDGVLYMDSRVRLVDVVDGASSTLLIGERPASADLILGWWYAGHGQDRDGEGDGVLGVRTKNNGHNAPSCRTGPYQFTSGRLDDQCDAFHFWSLHPGGANFAFCDGSVRFLAYSADPIMPALATRAGGEAVGVPE